MSKQEFANCIRGGGFVYCVLHLDLLAIMNVCWSIFKFPFKFPYILSWYYLQVKKKKKKKRKHNYNS